MANDDEDSQSRWDHVRKPLSSREVHTRSQVDMHYQQQLNGNFPLSSPNPLDFAVQRLEIKFSPPCLLRRFALPWCTTHDSFSLYGMAHSPHARRVCRGEQMVR